MYRLLTYVLFLLSPERAHRMSLWIFGGLLKLPFVKTVVRRLSHCDDEVINLFGLSFRHRVGLAAGFDKNADHLSLLETLNFAFIEIGSVTHLPSGGNPKPRLFRLPNDRAIINRMGLNNLGAVNVSSRLKKQHLNVPLFVNIAKTPGLAGSIQNAISDYCESIKLLKNSADVIVLNISCPNAGDGKTFENPELLTELLVNVRKVLFVKEKPLLIKISPDISNEEISTIVNICEQFSVSGFTATNTTTKRSNLRTTDTRLMEIGPGGLSGRPLHNRAIEVVRELRRNTTKPIVGVGGVYDHDSAQAFLNAGANLVQLYTGFIYGGPFIVSKINRKKLVHSSD